MTITNDQVQKAHGSTSFTLGACGYGYGGNDPCGEVHLTLTKMPLAREVAAQWSVQTPVPDVIRHRIEQHALGYVKWYFRLHAVLLHVEITRVSFNRENQEKYNRKFGTVFHPDYERAVLMAIMSALVEMSLPLPQIFASPEQEDTLNCAAPRD